MKIYANRRRGPSLTVEKLVGKDIWVLAQVGICMALQYIKIVKMDDTKIYYYSISATHINGLDLPSDAAVDVCKAAILSDLNDYERHPEWYACCTKNRIKLFSTAYTTEELYDLCNGDN